MPARTLHPPEISDENDEEEPLTRPTTNRSRGPSYQGQAFTIIKFLAFGILISSATLFAWEFYKDKYADKQTTSTTHIGHKSPHHWATPDFSKPLTEEEEEEEQEQEEELEEEQEEEDDYYYADDYYDDDDASSSSSSSAYEEEDDEDEDEDEGGEKKEEEEETEEEGEDETHDHQKFECNHRFSNGSIMTVGEHMCSEDERFLFGLFPVEVDDGHTINTLMWKDTSGSAVYFFIKRDELSDQDWDRIWGFQLMENGDIALYDKSREVVWSSDSLKQVTFDAKCVKGVKCPFFELEDSGNLMLNWKDNEAWEAHNVRQAYKLSIFGNNCKTDSGTIVWC
eukprot:scaffold627785_cov59-Attheya_sp.AAC.1